jgi:hypothetical protein
VVQPRRISDFKPLVSNLAQTSHYQIIFGGLPAPLRTYLVRKGVSPLFITENSGLLCYSASLPTTSLGTVLVDGNYTGVYENIAYNRVYNTISLDFYVDSDYKVVKFFESWMEFIASGSFNNETGDNPRVSQNNQGYFVRMQYPDNYKTNSTRIIKFDRDYDQQIEYKFIGLFPSDISPIAVSYVSSEILKVSVTFKFDRYIAGRSNSVNEFRGDDNNNESTQTSQQPPAPERETLVPISAGSAAAGGVRFVRRNATPYQRATEQFFDSQGNRRAP